MIRLQARRYGTLESSILGGRWNSICLLSYQHVSRHTLLHHVSSYTHHLHPPDVQYVRKHGLRLLEERSTMETEYRGMGLQTLAI